jgi:hypothetical protein
MAVTLVWAGRVQSRPAPDQLVAMLAASGVRIAFVLVGGMVLYFFVPYFKDQIAFWVWVLVVYPCTLALDVALMLTARPAAKTGSSAG